MTQRYFFDHIPKVAGQALQRWFENAGLNVSGVNPHILHSDAITLHQDKDIICAHAQFSVEDTLNSEFKYFTCIREPISRALSWTLYCSHRRDQKHGAPSFFGRALIDGAYAFLDSDGQQSTPEFLDSITNYQTRHFCHIEIDNPDMIVVEALNTLSKYALVGVYERFPDFLVGLSELLQIPTQRTIPRINETNTGDVTPGVMAKLAELNQLDVRFYETVLSKYAECKCC